jgi:hypothetical protein
MLITFADPPSPSPPSLPTPSSVLNGVGLKGVLPDSISAFVDINRFSVGNSGIEGAFPASAKAWTKLFTLDLWRNKFHGPLPALPYAQLTHCYLYNPWDSQFNFFDCPFPEGVVGKCYKSTSPGNGWRYALITENDCQLTCTGSSVNLPQLQCDAWVKFYDALNGDFWSRAGKELCRGTRRDPCACAGYWGDAVCDQTRTKVVTM